MHGHQLHGIDAQTLEMRDRRFGGQPRIRSAERLRDIGMQLAKALDVRLVDHHLVPRNRGTRLVAPCERRVDHGSQRSHRGVVPVVHRQIFEFVSDPIAEHLVPPAHVAADRFGIGIQQHLARVEPVPVLGFVRAVDAVSVQLPRKHIRQVSVPSQIGLVRQSNAMQLAFRIRSVKQAEFHLGCVLRKQREVHAAAVPRCAQWIRSARPDPHSSFLSMHEHRSENSITARKYSQIVKYLV
jgi:hypothetical protein